MKFKATKKEMKAGFYRIVSIGYCDAQYLLKYENPIAYSAGNCGWCCDYYDIDGTLIPTGTARFLVKIHATTMLL